VKVLLLAYEWPPISAAQALRWYYLANGLASRGVLVHVLCPDITSLPPYLVNSHPNVVEHRVWPGPFIGLAQALSGIVLRPGEGASPGQKNISRSYLMGVYTAVRQLLDKIIYPDVRTEWYPFARRRLGRLLREHSFDVIISSHEPGVDLLLGLWAQKSVSLPWVVDMADPLCAPYAPRWRRWLDVWFEGLVLRRADRVILTTDALRDVLLRRHRGLNFEKFATVAQGAPDAPPASAGALWSKPGKLHIVFTGNFYRKFRNPDEFAKALRLLNSPEIAVTIAGENIHFAHLFSDVPDVTFLNRLEHFECLALQGAADVLLNIGNTQDYQIPGKIFEYLVTGKAILHLRGSESDPSEEVLRNFPLSFISDNSYKSIADILMQLIRLWSHGEMGLNEFDVAEIKGRHGWSARSNSLKKILEDLSASRST
jgi:hypothetical protein